MDPSTTPTITFVTGKRGARNAVINGYRYTKNRQHKENTYYRCVEQTTCKARITLTAGALSSSLPTHSHPSQEATIAVLEVKNSIKKRSAETDMTTKEIVADSCQQRSKAGIMVLGLWWGFRTQHCGLSWQPSRKRRPSPLPRRWRWGWVNVLRPRGGSRDFMINDCLALLRILMSMIRWIIFIVLVNFFSQLKFFIMWIFLNDGILNICVNIIWYYSDKLRGFRRLYILINV